MPNQTLPSPLYSEPFFQDPYPTLAWLREHSPVHRFHFPWGGVPMVLVTRYDDVRQVLTDSQFSNNAEDHANDEFNRAGLGFTPFGRNLLQIDPPDHTRLRRLAMSVFTARNVEKWRALIRNTVHSLLDEVARCGEFDVVEQFAAVIPAEVIGRVLGMDSDHRRFVREQIVILAAGDPASLSQAADALREYAQTLIAKKRDTPEDDLTSQLVAARDDGDALSEDELVAMIVLFVAGGFDTTQNLITNAILAMLDHAGQQQLLQREPNLAPVAVEEFLRYESPVATLNWRFPKVDLDFSGTFLKAGTPVLCSTLAANRDDRRFENPDNLNIAGPAPHHVGLGHGVHHCIGAALARLEAQIALPAFVTRFPELKLAVERREIRYRDTMFLRSLVTLPVKVA